MTLVQNEALMCGFKEYAVSVKNQSTEVRVFVHGYTAILTFYISGRVVVKLMMYQKKHDDTILLDKIDKDYVSGKCTVADLASRYVYEVFNAALELRQKWRTEYRERYNERMAAMAAAVDEAVITIGDQPHKVITSDELKSIIEGKGITISDDSYLSEYDEL